MPEFAIVIRHTASDWEAKPDAEQRSILDRYFAWTDSLVERGAYRSSTPLRDGGRILRILDGRVVDGPHTETKEIVGGFVVVEAESLEEATEHAKTCPALEVGDSVEVRLVSSFER